MKKLSYIFLAAATLFAASCVEDLTQEPNDAPERTARLEVTSDNGLFVPDEDNTSATVNFKNAGGELVIAVSTNLDGWTASLSDDSWLAMESDKHYITLSADRNESTEALASVLTITAYDANDVTESYEVNISQNYAGQPEITVSSNTVRFPAYGELSTVLNVETNSDEFDFACTSQWLLVEKAEGGLKLSVKQNDDNAQRTVDLTLTAGFGKDAAKDVVRISQDGKAFVVLSSSVAHAEKDGSLTEITVESNPELEVSVVKPESDDWYTATYSEDGKLAVTITPAADSFQRKGEFKVHVGYGENTDEKTVRVIQIGEDTEELIVEYSTLNDNELLALPVISNTAVPSIDVVVDWGDGSELETVTGSYLGTNASPFKSHRYAKAGKYILTVKGTAGEYILSDNIYYTIETALYSAHLLKVISWGNLGVTSAARVCYNSNKLESIPSDVCGSFANVTNFSESFYLCESLKAIPENLFKYAVNATNFMRAFYHDGSITEIPENLFANNPAATDFSYCFHCVGVGNMVVGSDKWMVAQGHRIVVPEKLFANNPLAKNFTQTFYGTNITTVPENLFANNPEVTSFNGLFAYCTEMETVPANLFVNNTKVTNYGWLFYGSHVRQLPAGLFKGASAATNINQMFMAADVEDIPEGFFEGLTGVKYITQLFQEANFIKPLKSGVFKGLDNATAAFQMFYRSNISELPSGLFEGFGAKSAGVAFNQTFFDCPISSIPADLFDSAASNATSFNQCFAKCTKLTSIPEGLGSKCTKVNNIQSMFDGCTGLTTLPSSIFSGSASTLKTLTSVFANCTSITEVPDGFFSWITVANSTFQNCFNTCKGLEKVGANVFPEKTATTGINDAFKFCESLTDVSEDVFALCTNVNQMTRVFNACKALKTVPKGIFSHLTNVTTFQETFSECSGLQSVPVELFAANVAVTKFTKTFYNCTALKSLPAGLFDTNIKVSDFTHLCYGCKGLETLPDGLFDKNTAVTNFSYAFEYCENLKAIPDGLFAKCKSAKTFDDTFAGCIAITSIPADLFAGVPSNDTSVSFKECFTGCTNLTSIPASLFDAAKKAKNFTYTFAGCEKLTGESPFTTTTSGKIHLYERMTMAASDGFNASISGTNCFSGCTGLDDYDMIPAAWGGGK